MLHRILPVRCSRITRLYLLTALAVVLSATPLHTQTWEPTARLWGWATSERAWIEFSGSPPLTHLLQLPIVKPELAMKVYDLTKLSPEMQPEDDLHGLVSIHRIGDVNGNGLQDVWSSRFDDMFGPWVLLDAYTSRERLITYTPAEGVNPGEWFGIGTVADIDKDGIDDIYATEQYTSSPLYAVITYGDSLDPLSQQSVVPYTNAETPNARAVCLGTLEGKACMLRITWWWVPRGNDSTQMWAYRLDVLNEQDLRERRDTIRYETVQRYDVGSYGWAYRDCFIIFDDVWQLTFYGARRTCLRVQLTGIDEHEPDPSFKGSDTTRILHESMFGQARAQSDVVVRVDGRQPFITWFSTNRVTADSAHHINVPDLMIVRDPLTLESSLLGTMKGAFTKYEHGGRHAACTTPDIDGDGIGEVLLYYQATNPATNTKERLVDLFLTGDRPTTGVESREQRAESTEECASSVRSPDGWTLVCAMQSGLPASPTGCFDDAAVARVFDAQGRQVAEIPVVYGAEVRLVDPGTLPGSPLWAVIGSCTVRLQ